MAHVRKCVAALRNGVREASKVVKTASDGSPECFRNTSMVFWTLSRVAQGHSGCTTMRLGETLCTMKSLSKIQDHLDLIYGGVSQALALHH